MNFEIYGLLELIYKKPQLVLTYKLHVILNNKIYPAISTLALITGLEILTCLVILLLYNLNYLNPQIAFSQNLSGITPEILQNKTVGNFSGNATETTIVEGLGEPRDLARAESTDKFPLKARNISMELTRLSPTEIRQFQITVLSEEDIKSVLALLNPYNLAKVLLNISQEDLAEIQNMLSPSTFNQTLNRLSHANRAQVQDRLSEISSSVAILQ
jgi:hypothetical protein